MPLLIGAAHKVYVTMFDTGVTSCVCCGPGAIQRRCLEKCVKEHGQAAIASSPTNNKDTIWVHCENKLCDMPPQSYSCLMEFCDGIACSNMVPDHLYPDDLFLKTAMPLYAFYRDGHLPTDDVYMPFCIGCSLSALIPEDIRVTIPKHQRPLPLPQPATSLFEPEVSDNLTEHCVVDGLADLHLYSWESHEMGFSDLESTSVDPAQDDNNSQRSCDDSCSESSCSESSCSESSYAESSYADSCLYADDVSEVSSASASNLVAGMKRERKHISRKEAIASNTRQMKNILPGNDGKDDMKYLQDYGHVDLRPPPFRDIFKSTLSEAKKAGETGHPVGDELIGALAIPLYQIIVPAHASNQWLSVDIHGMAKSSFDNTPPVSHIVLSADNAKDARDYMTTTGAKLQFFDEEDFQHEVVDKVEMPESRHKTRTWEVDLLHLEQKVKVATDKLNNGRDYIPPEELIKYRVLSWMRPRKEADMIMMTGDFRLENDEQLRVNGRKLLCLRLQRLLRHAIPDDVVESMYTNVLPMAGRGGYEVTRTSGTNYKTCPQSHKNFLFVLHENDALLPNKAGACLIIPHKKYYIIVYRKHNPDVGESPIAVTKYAPPQLGGAFTVNGNVIDYFPFFGEFAYTKMLATLVLKRVNEIFASDGMPAVALGPVKHEMRNIKYARSIFKLEKSYRSFCIAFMSVNSMTLVAWPVGQHYDHFNEGGESLENKSTFVLPSIEGSIGRGGSFVGNQFVFALLDWQYAKRCYRKFYVTHADDMGIGPVQPRNAERLLTDFFETNPQGPRWRRRFNNYMRT